MAVFKSLETFREQYFETRKRESNCLTTETHPHMGVPESMNKLADNSGLLITIIHPWITREQAVAAFSFNFQKGSKVTIPWCKVYIADTDHATYFLVVSGNLFVKRLWNLCGCWQLYHRTHGEQRAGIVLFPPPRLVSTERILWEESFKKMQC